MEKPKRQHLATHRTQDLMLDNHNKAWMIVILQTCPTDAQSDVDPENWRPGRFSVPEQCLWCESTRCAAGRNTCLHLLTVRKITLISAKVLRKSQGYQLACSEGLWWKHDINVGMDKFLLFFSMMLWQKLRTLLCKYFSSHDCLNTVSQLVLSIKERLKQKKSKKPGKQKCHWPWRQYVFSLAVLKKTQ